MDSDLRRLFLRVVVRLDDLEAALPHFAFALDPPVLGGADNHGDNRDGRSDADSDFTQYYVLKHHAGENEQNKAHQALPLDHIDPPYAWFDQL